MARKFATVAEMSDIPYFTGTEIKEIRMGLGRIRMETEPELGPMTQAQFGQIITGVTSVTVSNWERGTQHPLAIPRKRLLRQWEIIKEHDHRESPESTVGKIFFEHASSNQKE